MQILMKSIFYVIHIFFCVMNLQSSFLDSYTKFNPNAEINCVDQIYRHSLSIMQLSYGLHSKNIITFKKNCFCVLE
jgi:hypothetical protein